MSPLRETARMFAKQDMHVYSILRHLAPHAKSYLGVGVQEGECVKNVVQANPSIASLTLCDTWGPYHGGTNRGSNQHIYDMLLNEGYKGSITMLDGSSQDLIPKMTRHVDMSYVDGDHAEAPALADMTNVWARTDVVMVVHDIFMEPVGNALNSFLLLNEYSTMIRVGGWTGTAVVYR